MLKDTEVLARALELPARQRAALTQKLLESLDTAPIDPDTDDAWADEIESRAAAYDRGETKSSDAGEVIERVRKSITNVEDYESLDPQTRTAIEEAEAQYERGEGRP